MENPENFTIKCSRCGSGLTDVTPLSGTEWLSTCRDCFQQDVLTDGDLAEAKRGGHTNITGKPLFSGGRSPQEQKTNPVIRNAESRAAKTQVKNPLILNAERRAKTQKMEVQSNV